MGRSIPTDCPETDVTKVQLEDEVMEEDFVPADDFPIPPPTAKELGRKYLSTGSTLLDLAMTGTRVFGGGIPSGIMMEFYGENSLGKTAFIAEIVGNAKACGGTGRINDGERRLDLGYLKTFGYQLNHDEFEQSMTVEDFFKDVMNWKPKTPNSINVYGMDGLASLTTNLEMSDKGDKMGMKRAKDFSAGLRKTKAVFADTGNILVCTNQIREGEKGKFTPGGKGIPFYASLRIELLPGHFVDGYKFHINKKIAYGKGEIEQPIGVCIWAKIIKNSQDIPFRDAMVYILFRYGIDDIRGNLQWLKKTLGATSYPAVDMTFKSMNDAIEYIESKGLEKELKKEVTETWYDIQKKMRVTRKKKMRG